MTIIPVSLCTSGTKKGKPRVPNSRRSRLYVVGPGNGKPTSERSFGLSPFVRTYFVLWGLIPRSLHCRRSAVSRLYTDTVVGQGRVRDNRCERFNYSRGVLSSVPSDPGKPNTSLSFQDRGKIEVSL